LQTAAAGALAGKAEEVSAAGELIKRLLWITAFRIAAVTALVGTTAVLAFKDGEPLGGRIAATLSALAIGTNLLQIGVAVLLRYSRRLKLLASLQVAGDVAFVSFLVYITGGSDSLFSFMYLLAIVSGGILLSAKGAWGAAILSFAADAAVILGMQRGILQPIDPAFQPSRLGLAQLLQALITHGSAFALTAVLSTYVAGQLRKAGARAEVAEDSLLRLHVLHDAIVRSVATGIATTDSEGLINFVNRSGEEILGRPAATFLGQPLESVFPTVMREAEKTGGRAERLESSWEVEGRPTRQLGFTVTPLVDDDGRQLGSIAVFQDLTAVRNLERRAARSERLATVGQLAAGLAHELRNPLASMSASIELLAQGGEGVDQERLRGIVLRESERLNRLVTEFLTFAGPAAPQLDLVDLKVAVEEVASVFAADPLASRCRRRLELQPAFALADPAQLKQVLWNLLRNAAEASAAGGFVELATGRAKRAGMVFLSVRDHGEGIARENLDRIFDPFFTTKATGTGLGLSTVHRIVEGLGGQVEVESVVGEGTRITVLLPETPAPSAEG